MKTHAVVKKQLLSNPEVRREYDRLGPEFELIQSLIQARSRAGLTQADPAERMKTTQSVIARVENGQSTPTWNTVAPLKTGRSTPRGRELSAQGRAQGLMGKARPTTTEPGEETATETSETDTIT